MRAQVPGIPDVPPLANEVAAIGAIIRTATVAPIASHLVVFEKRNRIAARTPLATYVRGEISTTDEGRTTHQTLV